MAMPVRGDRSRRMAASVDPPSCSICGGKAIYKAGRKGFCFDHRRDAEAEARRTWKMQSGSAS
ncbi:MAG: hypothetical protein AB7Q29_14900 [Vicinamibacterales bacterium]